MASLENRDALPNHSCAFCGAFLTNDAADLFTIIVGNPSARFTAMWCHADCIKSRVTAAIAPELDRADLGDHLRDHLARRRRD